jgi:co-chaperonin GroES (HSP10)
MQSEVAQFPNIKALLSQNTSGIHPTEFNVLVAPKAVETVTAGGIHLPPSKVEKDEFAVTQGRIIECSPHAFTYRTEEEWGDAVKPKPGDVALFARHSGTRVTGKDGKEYVLLNDREIAATIED